MNLAHDVMEFLGDSEKRKLKFEEENHKQFFVGENPFKDDDEYWILTLIEDGTVPFYRDEAFRYYYRIASPEDALEYIDEDKSWTIRLDKAKPDGDEDVVIETNDFDFRNEVVDFVEGDVNE